MSLSKALNLLKGASSRWIKQNHIELDTFAWQNGYGVFSLSKSAVGPTMQYVERQMEHHREKSFAQEYKDLLEENGVTYLDEALD